MKRNFLLLTLAATSVFSFAENPVLAQPKQATTKNATGEKFPADPDVKIGKLANGLTYYIRRNVEPRNRAVLYMALKAGSLMESDAQQGLAHFTEHMAFNGTKDFPKNELINYLQKAGVKFGADLNAYTSFDQTVYQLPIPTDSTALFHNGFKILANWAGHISMEDTDIDEERGIIVEEERQRGKNAQSRMQKEALPVILHGSRYAERIPIGKLDIIQNFRHQEIKSFYKDWYRPNLQAVIAVGDFDVAQVEALIKENFSSLKNPAGAKPHQVYGVPDNKEPMVKFITDKEFPYNVAAVTFRHHSKPTRTTADVKSGMIVSMVNAMVGTRIQELKQKGTAPFVEGQLSYGPWQGGLVNGLNALSVIAVTKDASEISKGLAGVMAEAERMAQFGFTASELEVVKKNIDAANERAYKEKDKIPSASFVQAYLKNFMYESPIISPDVRYNLTKKFLAEITLDDVNKAAKKMVKEENVTVLVQAPEKDKDKLPTAAQLLEGLQNAGKGLTAYVDQAVNKPLLEKKPAAGKVVSTDKIEKIGVTKLTLSNGVQVYLKPTDFKNDQIMFTSFRPGGTSLISDNDYKAMNYAGNIPGDGIGEFEVTTLRKMLAGTTAGASSYLNELYEGFSGSASPKDLETALQLVYAYATNPRKDPVAFKKNMDDYKVFLQNADDAPDNVFGDTIAAVFSSNNPREKKPTVADLDQISLDRSFEFYKSRFADASGQTFIFVGNFDVAQVTPLLETYLGGLPSANGTSKFVDRGVRPLTGNTTRIVKKGIEDKAQVRLFFYGEYEFAPQTNMQLSALSDILEFKVLERLREKESGVYSPNVGIAYEKLPYANYGLTISFSCASANVDKLVAATLDEIEKIKKEGATAVDVEKFKAESRRAMEVSLRENGFWLNYLTSKIKDGEDPTSVLTQNERLQKVTPESVKETANKYLSNANYFKAVLMPEK
ncbi:M16 family metallopeptidase [Chitinophaga sp. GCM10012297]|uniref:Insulinase family protein n=1 Tax=Chitinophaga chungangae TaxID=2821488 RepID=A0ABS3YB40_9BACT|nr:M16 family metallopeptidase [Chitinophaga chungangae]MBO9151690.1 insulinase family protein [Chitinophaga chungangae]